MFILTESYTTWSGQQWVGILADLLLDAESVPSTVNHKAGKYQWGPSLTRTSPAWACARPRKADTTVNDWRWGRMEIFEVLEERCQKDMFNQSAVMETNVCSLPLTFAYDEL